MLSVSFFSQVLLFHDQTYGIHYEYTVALNQSQENGSDSVKEPEHMYLWTHSSWEDCSVHCGGGQCQTFPTIPLGASFLFTLCCYSHEHQKLIRKVSKSLKGFIKLFSSGAVKVRLLPSCVSVMPCNCYGQHSCVIISSRLKPQK